LTLPRAQSHQKTLEGMAVPTAKVYTACHTPPGGRTLSVTVSLSSKNVVLTVP
jgi:hypothetical protein